MDIPIGGKFILGIRLKHLRRILVGRVVPNAPLGGLRTSRPTRLADCHFGRARCHQRAAQAPPHLTSKEAQERKNTSLDASSEGASDGPTKVTSKEAKLHGLGSVLFVRLQSSSFRGFTLTRSKHIPELLPAHYLCGKSVLAPPKRFSRFNETLSQSVFFPSFH